MNKKILLIALCGILLFGITGCGNESQSNNTKNDSTSQDNNEKNNLVLTCTNSEQHNYIHTDTTLTFNFQNSTLNKIEWKDVDTPEKDWWEQNWSSKEDEYLQIIEEQQQGCFENIPSVEYNVSLEDSVTTIIRTYEVNENNQDELEKDTLLYNNIKDIHNDYSKIKEYYENEGYTCK